MANDDDLWPADLVAEIPRTPTNILHEQAAALGTHTNNVVQAKVKGHTDREGDFIIQFIMFAPSLENYQYTLFAIWHDQALYPVHHENTLFNDEAEFREWLRTVFRSERTVRIVRAMVAQAKAEDDIPF